MDHKNLARISEILLRIPIASVLLLTLITTDPAYGSATCSQDSLQRCVRIAEPLLRNPDFIFPADYKDLNTVCSIWKDVVDCAGTYTSRCVPAERKLDVQQALDETTTTVSEMCDSNQYQQSYFQYAPCVKQLAASETKCRRQLNHLVDQVSALSVSSASICCANQVFQDCMFRAISRECTTGPDTAASYNFMKDMLSKALAFLLRQCQHYNPNSADCSGVLDTQPTIAPFTKPADSGMTDRTTVVSSWNTFTSKPWTPNVDNMLETPKQQGLSSSADKQFRVVSIRESLMYFSLVCCVILVF